MNKNSLLDYLQPNSLKNFLFWYIKFNTPVYYFTNNIDEK